MPARGHGYKGDFYEETYDEMTKFEDFFIAHWQKILNASIVAVVILSLFLVYLNCRKQKNLKAATEISGAATAAELEKVINIHSAHPSVNYARLKLAKMRFDEKKYEDALALYRKISETAKFPELLWQGKLNEGCTLETMKRNDEAAECFASVGGDVTYPASVRAEANCAAARIFLKNGKPERAKSCLKSVDCSQGSESYWTFQAKRLLEQINQPQ